MHIAAKERWFEIINGDKKAQQCIYPILPVLPVYTVVIIELDLHYVS